jgi:uncharacterized protein YjbJ (UPF0337 family)
MMNTDQMAGKWKQVKGAVKSKWGKLTDDDLDVINGEKEKLVGRIQERYGIAREEAQRQVDDFNRTHVEAPQSKGEHDLERKAS